ncbi:MAG: hypothetical protein ACFFCQ_17220 [Promethearchaeota archaeon]
MEKQLDTRQFFKENESICGIVSVNFSADLGPSLGTNASNLDLEAAIFLSLRGFTALMAGVDYEKLGPGKIRGMIEIPNTPYYALGIDIIVEETKRENKRRLMDNIPVLLFVIVHNTNVGIVRKYWDETETYLTDLMYNISSIEDLTENRIIAFRESVSQFLHGMKNDLPKGEPKKTSLFDISVLLSLDSFVSNVAQALLDLQTASRTESITARDIVEELDEDLEETIKALKKLVQMGYVSMTIPHNQNEEPYYRAF